MKNNYCIIMAGGIGSRFWPVSKNDRPKQFLDFFGTGKSLLQATISRFLPIVPAENIFIVSNIQYKETILEQLPFLHESQILLEPARRNTAPCIAYAIARIKAITSQANIIVAPSDHLILDENTFINIINDGLNYINSHDELLTIGIKPSRPETGYGYIQAELGGEHVHKVKRFTEKPNYELAQEFLTSGDFLWNAGIFLWNLRTIDLAFHEFLPDVSKIFDAGEGLFNTPEEQKFINDNFVLCPNISIDYGIMEKAKNVGVIAGDFGWSDLGTWGSLFDISTKDADNNVKLGGNIELYNAKDNIVAISENKLAIINGLNDYIVAESGNAILICPKANEQEIRQFVKDIEQKYNSKYN